MATLTPKRFYRGQPLSGGSTLHTAPLGAGLFSIVKQITLHNTDAVPRNIKVNNVAAAGASSASNRFIDYTLEPMETVNFDMSMVLNAGEMLQATTATSSSITVIVSGIEAS